MIRNPLLVLLAVLASLLFTSNAHAVYHVQTGRFLQADPNGLGQPLITDAGWFGGRAPILAVRGVNIRQHYGDGMNHFQYLRSNPINRSDPLGLMSTLELGGVGGIQGLLAGLLNGAASVGTSIGGLMTSGGIWAINTTASGALAVGMNFDGIMMFASNADANWNNWVNEFNNWASGGGPQYDPDKMTTSQNLLARDWGVTTKQVGDGIHQLKSGNAASGAQRNPDLIINRVTGDAFIKGTTEYGGNLKEVLGL